jgi:hypothetical protein
MALIDVKWKPGAKDLRIFALLFLVFAAALGAPVFYFKYGWVLAAKVLWVAAGVVGVVGLILPRLVLPVYVVMMALALPIGMVVSTVLLAVIYYLVVTPIGLVARVVGYDPMARRLDPKAATYWIERDPNVEARRYFRQY